jgi:hypothetical protein
MLHKGIGENNVDFDLQVIYSTWCLFGFVRIAGDLKGLMVNPLQDKILHITSNTLEEKINRTNPQTLPLLLQSSPNQISSKCQTSQF